MAEKIEFEDYFGTKINPATEEFVRLIILYYLHKNHYILLERMDIDQLVKDVGDTVRIHRHSCRFIIREIINGTYPGDDELTVEYNRFILYHCFLWFYAQKCHVSKKRIFIMMAAFAMEVIVTAWKVPQIGEEIMKSTLYILSSVFSGREFKRCLKIEGFKMFAASYTSKNIDDFRNVEKEYFQGEGVVRKRVSMDYLARGADGDAESLSAVLEEIKQSIKACAEKSEVFVNLLEQCNKEETEKNPQTEPDEDNFREGLQRITENVKGFISQVRHFVPGADASSN